ncbi:MAG: cupin domain-containing protein [Candidatus Thorarchaeota archaeon]
MIVKHIRENLGSQDGTMRILGIWDDSLNPGTLIDPHYHTDIEEVYYILEGEGEVLVGHETRHVNPGHVVYIPPNQLHTIRPRGKEPLRWITIAIAIDPELIPSQSKQKRSEQEPYIA